jgi:AcrR family transcriptional regulator
LSRKIEILDALIEIFKEKGLSNDFTMAELAQHVNIGKSTIYEYFSNKDEVVQQAMIRVMESSIEKIKESELPEGNFEAQLKNEMKTILAIAMESRFMFNLVTPGMTNMIPEDCRKELKDEMESIMRFYQARYIQIFQKGVVEKELTPTLLQENGLLIASLITGSIMRFANANIDLEENSDIDIYVDKVYRAVKKICN